MIKPTIIPIITPKMNWDSYLRDGYTQTGKRFNKSLDADGMKLGQDESIIVGLSQFTTDNYLDANNIIRECGLILKFLHFVFLCTYEKGSMLDIIINSELTGLLQPESDTWIISGTLLQWKNTIIDYCNLEKQFGPRFFMNCAMVLFRCNGYNQLFEAYSKITIHDGTFILNLKI